MSISKWAYIPDQCDGNFCVGDCDRCPKAEDNVAIREKRATEISLKNALKDNPYNPEKGNEAAYARYLRYNVYGWYNKTNEEVRKLWKERENEM